MPSRYRVAAAWFVGLLTIVLARPSLRSLAMGLPVALVGELVRLWASGHIEKTVTLATGGPYAHSRNPLYVGSSLLAVGALMGAASPWATLVMVAYAAAFYPSLVNEEARFLRGKFGAAYARWAEDVPMFVPRLTPAGPRSSRFSWERVRRNREWRTLLALPGLALVFWLRSLV